MNFYHSLDGIKANIRSTLDEDILPDEVRWARRANMLADQVDTMLTLLKGPDTTGCNNVYAHSEVEIDHHHKVNQYLAWLLEDWQPGHRWEDKT